MKKDNKTSNYIFFIALGGLIGVLINVLYMNISIKDLTETLKKENAKTQQLQKELEIKQKLPTKEINETKINPPKTKQTHQNNLPTFIVKSLEKLDISSKNLDKKQWENFLETSTILRIQKSIIENKSEFSFKQPIDFDTIKKAVYEGNFDINKPNNIGMTFIGNYIKNAKKFDLNELNLFKELGVDFTHKKEKDLMHKINGDLIFAALSNPNDEIGYKFLQFLEDNGGSIFNDNYKLHLSAIGGKKYKNKYYSKILPLVNVNELIFEVDGSLNIYETVILSDANNEIVSSLLKRKLDIKTTPEKENVLHYASKNSHISNENYQKFIDLGSNVNARDSNLRTPLMLAVLEGKVDQVKILLKNGANIDLEDRRDKNVYDYLKKVENLNIKEKIKSILHEHEAMKIVPDN